tara:strand:- start:12181 stop:12858 length:678 start_codon:yes stop_codon:yes gene_type:complete
MISFHNIAKGSNHLIKFLHVATGTRVEFPAFITEFSDTFNVSWGSEMIFGRMDPIKPYQGTTRSISLAFDVLSNDIEMAKDNMNKYSRLIQMLYPVYNEPLTGGIKGKGRTIKAPPILRIQFVNLVKNNSEESVEEGLLGCINGFTFNPNRESGFFTQTDEILPKVFNISIKFDPQHEATLGFQERKFLNQGFPYGRPKQTPSSDGSGQGTSEVSSRTEADLTNN